VSGGLLPPADASATFRAADGVLLHSLSWPVERPRAVVLLSHGLGEHAGRYAALARDLAPRGVEVHALDHRGHGRSGGIRGHTPRWEALVEDFDAFAHRVMEIAPADVPLFLLGHSLGGLIAIRWLEAPPAVPLRGAILSAPLLGIAGVSVVTHGRARANMMRWAITVGERAVANRLIEAIGAGAATAA